jgi:hypothetical protein
MVQICYFTTSFTPCCSGSCSFTHVTPVAQAHLNNASPFQHAADYTKLTAPSSNAVAEQSSQCLCCCLADVHICGWFFVAALRHL